MNFTVQKKQYLSEKKVVQRGSPEKKIPAQAVSEIKKKFVQPPPPITFLMVRPLQSLVTI